MTREEFWALIETARRETAASKDESSLAHADATCEWLEAHLATLAPDEIVSFETHSSALQEDSYRWSLWGAAYLVNGGCSDDGFDYFRGWLLAQGQATFEAAMTDPDSLADVVPDEGDVECEDFLYLAPRAYEAACDGEEIPMVRRTLANLGESWDFDDKAEMERRYPRLWARFGW